IFTIPTALGCVCDGMFSSVCTNTKSSTGFLPGNRPWSACFLRLKKQGSHEYEIYRRNRKRCALRGVPALPVPSFVGEESPAVQLRRSLSAVLRRSAGWLGRLAHADRVSCPRGPSHCSRGESTFSQVGSSLGRQVKGASTGATARWRA